MSSSFPTSTNSSAGTVKLLTLMVLLTTISGGRVAGQTSTASPDPVDTYIERQLKKQTIPGLALAVVRSGTLVKARGYGLADIELNVPATERSIFQWGSVTKQFTATAIMQLVEEGKVKLDDSIGRYYAKAPAAWTNVTIRHLLTHTSGIKSYTSLPDFMKNIRKDYETDDLIGLVIDSPLEFAPGEKWSYSNTGYFLLGLVIEKAGGRPYSAFLAEHIFRPCGMRTARVNDQFELIPNRATGYDRGSNQVRRAEFASPTQPYAAGALVGSVLDLAKWDAALYTEKVLPGQRLEEMWTPAKLNNGKSVAYGYGWSKGGIRGHPFVGHGGGIPGFTSYILRLIEDKLTVIVLLNTMANPEQLAVGVAGEYIQGLTLSSLPPREDADRRITERLKLCLYEMAQTKDSPILTPQFRKGFSTSRRRLAELQQDLKELKSFSFVVEDKPDSAQGEQEPVPVTRLRSYRLETGGGTRYYTFALTSDNQVARVQAADE